MKNGKIITPIRFFPKFQMILVSLFFMIPGLMSGQSKATSNGQAVAHTKPDSPNKKSSMPKKAKKLSQNAKAEITFLSEEIDFDTIKAGTKVKKKFYFTNTGYAPLQINRTEVSCGCTSPSFPFVDIKPLEQGYIEMTFNSEGKIGNQRPSLKIFTNASTPVKTIYMKGVVE